MAASLAGQSVRAAQADGALVDFIACPIYRDTDTGRKSGCWLADDPASGLRYDVSLSPYKPDWNYAVLVEGRLAKESGPGPCGGAVLSAVRTSRLYDQPCPRHMLPAEGYPGRHYSLDPRHVDPLSAARMPPAGPFQTRTFALFFEFGSTFAVYQYDDFLLDRAVAWIRAARPSRLVVTGFAATRPVTIDGQALAESPALAAARADIVAESLRRLLPGMPIETTARADGSTSEDPDADNLPDQSRRRVEIRADM